jgi:hypothetical protein
MRPAQQQLRRELVEALADSRVAIALGRMP